MAVVVFDMDGTLSERDHILRIYHELGMCEKAKQIHANYRDGLLDHKTLWEQGTALLKGVPREKLIEIAAKVEMRPDAAACIEYLQSHGHDVFVLTDGYAELVEQKVPCDVYGKSIEYADGCVDSLGHDWMTEELLYVDGKSRLLRKAGFQDVIVVDDHAERISDEFERLDPNDFANLMSVADYIVITRAFRDYGRHKSTAKP